MIFLTFASPIRVGASDDFGTTLYAPHDLYSTWDAKPTSGDVSVDDLTDAIERGAVSDAFRAAAHICSLDPDHAAARRLLGYSQVDGQWCGGYAALMSKRGYRWHREYGWIRSEDVDKWQAGERPWGKRWIDAAEDVRRHEAIEKGWTLRTDHFLVTTNHSRAAAVDLSVRLETLYQLWRQLFGEFAASERELKARLEGKQSTGHRSKPFRVIYHRTREQYNAALRRRQPQIDVTLGIYFDRDRETHFFAGDDQDPGTIHHEAVHQFFFESKPTARRFAALANAWATEGVACYFESLQENAKSPGIYSIGAPDAGRLHAARHRRLVDDYYVPMAELSALGMDDLQQRDDLPQLYSQSAGLATFLIQYDGGKYRAAFRELLAAVYAGRDDAGTLQETCGVAFGELDREYRTFVEGLPGGHAR